MKTRVLATALLAWIVSTPAYANPTMYSFSGYVVSNIDHGQTVNGYLLVDPVALSVSYGDGTTWAQGVGSFDPPYTSPMQIRGFASDGTHSSNVGGGVIQDYTQIIINKAVGGYIDYFGIHVQSDNGSADGANVISLWTQATTDGIHPSGIFDNTSYANPDLSLGQHVNWGDRPVYGSFGQAFDQYGYTVFAVTSLAVTSVAEPSTVVLFGCSLATVFAMRRRVRRGLRWGHPQ